MNTSGRVVALFGPWLVLLRLLALLPFGRQFAVLCWAVLQPPMAGANLCHGPRSQAGFPFLSIQLARARSAAVDADAAAAADNNARCVCILLLFCLPKEMHATADFTLLVSCSPTLSLSLYVPLSLPLYNFQLCLSIFDIDRKLTVVPKLIVS